MRDEEKNKEQLIYEKEKLRQKNAELKKTIDFELAQVKEELKSREDKYQAILDSIAEAYFELDLAGNFTLFNKSALQRLGYTPEEMTGMNYRDYVPPRTAERLFERFNEIYRTGKTSEIFEYQIIRKDGSRRYRDTSVSLKKDSSGRKIGFRCVARDVTKRKLAEDELKKKDRELKIKAASLEETNTALKVLLKQREDDKIELEKNVLSNIREIIIPYVKSLGGTHLSDNQRIYVETIEFNLMNIKTPFLRNITLTYYNLTPKEFHVANLVKEGRTTKEIASFLGISTAAIDFHRNSIRKKLGLNNKKVNLRSYLLSLS